MGALYSFEMIRINNPRSLESWHIFKNQVVGIRIGLPKGRGRPGQPKKKKHTWRRTVENKRQAAKWQLRAAVTALAPNRCVPHGMDLYWIG